MDAGLQINGEWGTFVQKLLDIRLTNIGALESEYFNELSIQL